MRGKANRVGDVIGGMSNALRVGETVAGVADAGGAKMDCAREGEGGTREKEEDARFEDGGLNMLRVGEVDSVGANVARVGDGDRAESSASRVENPGCFGRNEDAAQVSRMGTVTGGGTNVARIGKLVVATAGVMALGAGGQRSLIGDEGPLILIGDGARMSMGALRAGVAAAALGDGAGVERTASAGERESVLVAGVRGWAARLREARKAVVVAGCEGKDVAGALAGAVAERNEVETGRGLGG